ncbi:unnamed protein product [Mesocestoides corti]|uniref:Uncharacterized protein n=1 Tax=Mesocestoides corti TaxID=53468 RepID=A0A0R3UIF0_MESCO|nr:unnamed protein product [Mesocestoides corti]
MSLLATISGLLKHLAEQKKQKDELNTSSNKSLDDLSSELLELQRSVTYVLSGLRRQAVQSSHMSDEVLKSAKAQFLRQHRDLGGKKPFLESASSAAKAPFDALLFDSEKRDGQTPYGPSPFATTMSIITGVTTVVPSVVGAPTTNFSLSSGNLQPTAPLATTATTGGFSFSTFKPTPPAATAFTLGGTTQTTSATTGGFGLGGFGAVSTSATASKGFGFGLGATNATGFGVTSTAPSLGFGVTSTTPSVGFGATSTTPSTNFGFGAPASTTGATLFGSSPAAKPGLFTIK